MYTVDNQKDTINFKDVQGQHITAVERNVLVLGSGGREHALAWKIAQSERVSRVYIAPGNAGTASIGTNISINIADFQQQIGVNPFAVEKFVLCNVFGISHIQRHCPIIPTNYLSIP